MVCACYVGEVDVMGHMTYVATHNNEYIVMLPKSYLMHYVVDYICYLIGLGWFVGLCSDRYFEVGQECFR